MHQFFTASALTILQTGTELVTEVEVDIAGVFVANAIVFIPSTAALEKPNWGDYLEVFITDGTTETPLCTFGCGGTSNVRVNLGDDVTVDGISALQWIGARYHNVVKGGNNIKGCLNIDGRQVA